jgi:hypothetical protein
MIRGGELWPQKLGALAGSVRVYRHWSTSPIDQRVEQAQAVRDMKLGKLLECRLEEKWCQPPNLVKLGNLLAHLTHIWWLAPFFVQGSGGSFAE